MTDFLVVGLGLVALYWWGLFVGVRKLIEEDQ